jgi:hypothetical protein
LNLWGLESTFWRLRPGLMNSEVVWHSSHIQELGWANRLFMGSARKHKALPVLGWSSLAHFLCLVPSLS